MQNLTGLAISICQRQGRRVVCFFRTESILFSIIMFNLFFSKLKLNTRKYENKTLNCDLSSLVHLVVSSVNNQRTSLKHDINVQELSLLYAALLFRVP